MLRQRFHILIMFLVGSGFVAGCSQQTPTAPPLPPSGTWEIALFRDDEGRFPTIATQVWMGDEVLFMIVPTFKRAGGGGGSGGGGLPEKAWFHGETYLPDGKTEVSFEAETIDGKVESVTIADKSYDLKSGRLFVVSLTDGGFEVNQIEEDTRKLTPTHEDPTEIEAFLRSVPEFEKFWSEDAGGD